jgi:phage-related tail protein
MEIKELNKDMRRAYNTFDDARAQLENVSDSIKVSELVNNDFYFSLSESIYDWLGDMHRIDENINDFFKETGILK